MESKARTVIVAVLALLVAGHLAAVTVAAVPPRAAPAAAQDVANYLFPFFRQDWRLFAPNPIGHDRWLMLQPAWQTADGVEEGEWTDLTSIEMDLVRHELIGGRAGYGTHRLTISLDEQWNALTGEQQKALREVATAQAPLDSVAFEQTLAEAGTPETLIDSVAAFDAATIALATDVLRALHPDRDLVAVRYGIRRQNVTPWERRGDDAARPNASQREGVWRTPADPDPNRSAAIGDFIRRHT